MLFTHKLSCSCEIHNSFVTFSRYNCIVSWSTNDFGDALVQIDVLSIDIRQSVLDRALVHLQFHNFLLNVVGI